MSWYVRLNLGECPFSNTIALYRAHNESLDGSQGEFHLNSPWLPFMNPCESFSEFFLDILLNSPMTPNIVSLMNSNGIPQGYLFGCRRLLTY